MLEGNNIIETSSDSNNPVITSDNGQLGHLKVSGSGSLTVTETTSGITNPPYIFACQALTIEGGAAIQSNMQLCTINKDFTLNGGSVVLKGEYVKNGIYVNAGDVIIQDGNLDISGGKTCMFLPGIPPTSRTSNVKISGGNVKLQASVAAVYSAYAATQTDETDNFEVTGGNVNVAGLLHVRKINIAEGANLFLNAASGLNIKAGSNIGAKLAGGTYTGSQAAIQIEDEVNLTLADLLEKGYAFVDENENPIALEEGQKKISGTVTVKKCDHKGAEATNNGGGKHTLACPYCGHTGTAENCVYAFSGNEGTCSACKDKVTVTVSGTEGLVYDGSAKTPAVTVKRGETVLTEGTDYTVVYENNKSAGTAKVNVTIGQDQGTYTKQFSIGKKELTVAEVSGSKTYDGSNQVPVSSITLEGVVSGDTVAVNTAGLKAAAGSANAGTYTTVTLPSGMTLTGADAAKYTLTQPSGVVSAPTRT